MRLVEALNGTTVRITGFEGGKGLEGKLRQLGLGPGDSVRVLRRAPFKGPLLIEVRGREIAVGAGVASKIQIEVQACASR